MGERLAERPEEGGLLDRDMAPQLDEALHDKIDDFEVQPGPTADGVASLGVRVPSVVPIFATRRIDEQPGAASDN